MKEYIALLRESPLFAQLSRIQLLSYFGAWFSNVAIYTLLLQLQCDATTIALVAALHFLPGVFQAPLSGVLIDKIAPKRLLQILISIEIVATLGLLGVDHLDDMWLLYLLIFIRMGASSFFFTVEMALLPSFLEGRKLQVANEIHSIIWSTSYTLGMALSGVVVYLIGIHGAIVIDASLFLIGWIWVYRLDLGSLPLGRTHESVRVMITQGWDYLRTNPRILHLMFLHALISFAQFDILITLAVPQYYHLIPIPLAIGILNAARAFGLMIGPFLLSRWISTRRLGWLLIAEGLLTWGWAGVMESFYLSLVVSIFLGLVTTTLWAYTYTLLQHHTHNAFYGRVIAYNDMLFLGMGAIVSLGIGQLSHWAWSLESIAMVLGAVFVLGALYYRWLYRAHPLEELST